MAHDRTEKATPKRREDARKKGQLARRPEVAAAASFLAVLFLLKITGADLLRHASLLFSTAAGWITARESLDPPTAQSMLIKASSTLALLSLPPIAAALTAGVAGNLAQGGLNFAPEAFKPRAERFNPIANLKRVLGANGPIELVKNFLKLGGLTLATYSSLAQCVAEAPQLIGTPPVKAFGALGKLIYDVGLRAGFIFFMVGVLDYLYGWYKHEKSLRMTKQELKDEFRKQEGDPIFKGYRRRAARALSRRRIAAEVPRADVVVVNPTHFSVALKYDRAHDAAPTVIAKGADLIAKQIREIAKAHDVPIVENPPLARSLYNQVEIGEIIPAELFRAVAEVLAYVYQRRERHAAAN